MFSTTISTWAYLVWEALQDLGHDPRLVFERAGLDPARLADPNARYPQSHMHKLWCEAGDVTNDPCFGLEAGRRWKPTTFHALGFAWLASSTLHDALERLTRYIHVVNSSVKAQLELRGARYVFTYGLANTNSAVTVHPATIDAGIVALMQMCRQICGQGYEPQGVLMTHARPPCHGRLEAFFRAPVQYDAGSNGLVFDAQSIDRRLPTANAELARINEEVVLKYLSHLDRASVATQVKSHLIELLPAGHVGEEPIAQSLNMSLRSLQRKLLEEGTSYARLLEETRRDMAKNYIENSILSINEIAYLLGFSEPANFTRAFRRWYDVTPSSYRGTIQKTAFS
jgi:AraC-like DNA-binding protein